MFREVDKCSGELFAGQVGCFDVWEVYMLFRRLMMLFSLTKAEP